jgi:FAD/FMN-containing dehydrogenase
MAVATDRQVDPRRIAAFRAGFDGDVLEPADPGYDRARQVWNLMVDRHPALVVRPAGAVDVATAVRFAREEGLEISVRGGGHGVSGQAAVDGGLMINLSSMRGVRIDPIARRAYVQGGALLVDVDREASVYGMAVPAGVNWDTGVGGLTLGGGYGWLGRMYGLTSDNLVSAQLVTADGEIVTASADEDPELFWGIRGGGGNFGIATWFEYRVHPVPPSVHAIDLFFAAGEAHAVAQAFFDTAASAPRTATGYLGIQEATADAGFAPERLGEPIVVCGFVVIEEEPDMKGLYRLLRSAAEPVIELPWDGTFRALQHLSSTPPGVRMRRYWKSHYISEISAGVIDEVANIDRRPPFYSELEFVQQGGAIMDLPPDATAFAQRDALFDFLAVGSWHDPAEDEARMSALRATAARFEPFSSGVYFNNLADEGEATVRTAFRDGRFARLQALKTRMDPDNVFHRNANIPPASR